MPRDFKQYLEDILESAQKIETRVAALTFEQFQGDAMLTESVLYNLLIIGEATKKLPEEITARDTEIEWRRIAGLRDIIAHEYFGVDLAIIWDAIQKNLPGLRETVAIILAEETE